MDILENPLPMPNLRRRERVDGVTKVGHNGLAHFLLMSDGRDSEFPWLLLG